MADCGQQVDAAGRRAVRGGHELRIFLGRRSAVGGIVSGNSRRDWDLLMATFSKDRITVNVRLPKPQGILLIAANATPLGIRPINDLAFKKTFGTEENRLLFRVFRDSL